MKASRRHLSSSSSRRLDQDEYIRLSYMSSEDVFVKTNTFVLAIPLQDTSRRFQDVFKMSCQDVFKTASIRLAKTSSRHLQGVFKTSSRHFQDVLQRCLQDVLKTYHQIVNCLPRSRIYLDRTSEKFTVSVENLQV